MGVTLELLHLEYLQAHPTGLRYTAFCDVYRRWLAKAGVVMRQTHKAGEKCFVDYSGKKPSRQLAQCAWVAEHLSVLLVGTTGVGKSYLVRAI